MARRNVAAAADVSENLGLLGWIETKRERYDAAAKYFIAALDHLRATGEAHAFLQARMIHAAGIVASETVDLALGRRVRDEYDRVSWTGSLRREQFNSLTCMHFLSLLEGDIDTAYLLGRKAAEIAPKGPYAAIGETNGAVLSGLLGDEYGAALSLKRAWELLRSYAWTSADDEERIALTNFAIAGAATLPVEARKAVTLYQSLRAKANPLNALYNDRRLRAFEAMAAGRVSEALGRRLDAVGHYGRSLDQWQQLNYRMRAALVALDLRRLTGEERYATIVEEVSKRAPSAWLARRLKGDSPLSELTQAELRVLAGLLDGKSTKGVAADLHRSRFTVANHIRKIFAAFGVRSRAKLLARCGAMRITLEDVRRSL